MDIGGTFTDVVAYVEDTGEFHATKAATTPADLAAGVHTALADAVDSPQDVSFAVHGTTQGLNTFLERRGARVLLLASAEAADTYHIARGPRRNLYDLHYHKPEPLVPRSDVVGIAGRIDHSGAELTALDEDAVRACSRRYRTEGFEAIAVAYLFSYANPDHERRTREILHEELGSDVTVALSHESVREWREYERTSSAVVEAYTGPVVRRYLSRLEHSLRDAGLAHPLHIMQSSGGVSTAELGRQHPLQTLLSGPVGGTMGGIALAEALGRPNLVCVDMGGTSFDVSLVIDGVPDISPETELEGLPLLLSVVNIHTIGAGGGSLAWVENGGLRVGPRSAGADPGPACYGLGNTEPTVTDANLVLGRIDTAGFTSAGLRLHQDRARAAVAGLGETLGMSDVAMAEGICSVANAKMAQAIRTITVSRGIEPRDFTLVAFGGAGPMHAAALAEELGMREVVIPRFPGAFSAWGMLQTDVRRDFSEPYYRRDADLDPADMARTLAAMAETAVDSLDSQGISHSARSSTLAVDVRYAEQSYTRTVPLRDAAEPHDQDFLQTLAERFATLHEARYGHANLGAPIELVTLRCTAHGALQRLDPEHIAAVDDPTVRRQEHPVVFDGQRHSGALVHRDDLGARHSLVGPAVVVEQTATTVVPPEHTLTVDPTGALLVTRRESS